MSGFTRVVHRYTVRVEAHRVEPRFDIPEREFLLYARSRREAIRDAVYAVASEAGIPGWKPWLRDLARHAVVVACDDEKVRL